MSRNATTPKPKSSLTHFLAGLYTGLITSTLLQPADLLKTRLQEPSGHSPAPLLSAFRSVLSTPNANGFGGGILSLWRGTLPSVIRTGLGSALYYSSLNALRSQVSLLPGPARDGIAKSSSTLPQLSKTANLFTGAVARAAAGFVLMPATVVKVRYESSLYKYGSLVGACKAIWKQDGGRGFFQGAGATAVRDAPFAGLYLVVYEEGKGRLNRMAAEARSEEGMNRSTALAINSTSAVLAAAVASAITNPFDAVKTRLQLMPQRYVTMMSATSRMVREEGWRSLMQGFALRTGRKVVSLALSWTLYEELVRRSEVKDGENL